MTKKSTKPAPKKAAPKKRNPNVVTIRDIANMLNTQHDMLAEVNGRTIAMEARIIDRIDATAARLVQDIQKVESNLAVLRSGASFMQELEQNATKPIGLQVNDYCTGTKDEIKELAEQLTSLGLKWEDHDRHRLGAIVWDKEGLINTYHPSGDNHRYTLLDRDTFLARARVTAAELGLKPEPVKVPKFGDRVMYDGVEYKIGCDEPSDNGLWRLCPSKAASYNSRLAKRSGFTLLDPHPPVEKES